ncbi:HlyD family secretion protein [Vibrio owensii]|uniref:HlyD family secretion protein n=1 Tax=Vibrio owensii TaxID=696485 RepID=UPI0033918FB8
MDKFIKIITAIALILFVWYVAADRVTPFTSNARVKAIVTPIIPRVSGTVIEIPAKESEAVEAGALLARIDARQFEIAVALKQAELETATQEAGASSADVARAQAQLARALADLENINIQSARWFELERKKLIPKARADEARATLSDAESAVNVAKAELERARRHLGREGLENPRIKAALSNLASAELDLSFTELRAPARGGVVNLTVAAGAQAQTGKTLMTFVDGGNIWVEAYMTENNLGHVQKGDPVDVVLDTHPGQVFKGHIESVVSAVYHESLGADGLPNPQNKNKWLRESQRFPVRILLSEHHSADIHDDIKLFLNGQADVIIYASNNGFMNLLGGLYIRVAAMLSYIY